MPGYRIGYLNPWTLAAENHACASLQIAARRIGHELIPATNSDQLLAANLDFVIAVASTQPRTTDLPTFANIHEPRTRWWENQAYFSNLLTYDGYLTISDTLRSFVRSFVSGFEKDTQIGEFFSSPQRQQLRADVPGLAGRRALRLCYFGTNWDPRSRPLFRELAKRSYMQVRGPEQSWQHLPREAYFGSVPFDGQSVQTVYANHGAGLVVHSLNHTIDDVVSNRIFEICSVGAAAVAPDMPWLRSRFGDTLHYYDPWAPANDIVQRIDSIMQQISEDPHAAGEMAEAARSIFEKRYCAEKLLGNAVSYFEDWKARQKQTRAPGVQQPLIDVIVRVGGRPIEVVARAIRSIDDQTMGRFRIVFVRYKELDLAPIVSARWNNIEAFEIVDLPGGNRALTMAAGLRALASPYFAALDDDDYWLRDHVQCMWRVLKQAPENKGLAYCGLMDVEDEPIDASVSHERRNIVSLTPAAGNIWNIVGKFGTVNFMASSALVEGLDLEGWEFTTAEDTLMICHMLPKAEVSFTWRATACTAIHSNDRSNYKVQSLQRREDVLEVFLRLGPRVEAIERKFSATPSSTWGWLGSRVSEVFESRSKQAFRENGRLVLEEGMLGTSIHDRDDIVATEIPIAASTLSLAGDSSFETIDGVRVARIKSPAQAWAYAASMDLRPRLHPSDPQWIVVEFDAVDGAFGVGITRLSDNNFLTRIEIPKRQTPIELWLHIGERNDVARLIVQNWGTFEANTAVLRRISVVRKR